LEVTSECSEEFHGCFGYEARLSVVGERGAFLAARGYDVGSPGYSEEIPQGTFRCPPKLLSIRREGAGISISCRVSQGRSYQLLTKQTLDDPVWLDGPVQMANTPVITFVEPFQPGTAARFFAVREQ